MRKARSCFALVLVAAVVFTAGTNLCADTPFAIQSIQLTTNGGVAIAWPAATGLVNQVLYSDSLDQPWQNLLGGYFPGGTNANILSCTDFPAAATTQRYYMVAASQPQIIMSLVLDRSGSMLDNGGSVALAPAVTNFISLFSDSRDKVAMVSFSSAASVNVPMGQPFIRNVQDAVLALSFGGDTCSDQGLTNALAQINSITISPGQNVVRVIVFFTDGMANTFNYNFDCGPQNIGLPDGSAPMLFDPTTGDFDGGGCTIPAMLSSIDPSTGVLTTNAVSSTDCLAMHNEAANRAERIAYLARAQGITIYCIGMGNPATPGECNGYFPVLNPTFLENLANTANSATFNPGQPQGYFAVAEDANQLEMVFQMIASGLLAP